MRKNIIYFTIIATILLFGACNNEDLLPEANTETGRTLSLTASMPNEPTTRVDLTQDGKNIKLTWKLGDQIHLAYVQGTNKADTTVTVDSISNGGKNAHFDIPIPDGATGQFDVYGVYGLEGIDITGTNPLAKLPNFAETAGSLASVQNREDVMLYFELKMQTTDTEASITFKHLGSLFSITINNINQDNIAFLIQSGITVSRLAGVDGDNNWAYNSGDGGLSYDLVNKEFLNPESASNYLSFNLLNTSPIDDKITVWGWYPMTGKVWPELQLLMTKEDGTVVITSNNSKPAKPNAPIAGMSYHFYATINADQSLSFTNDKFIVDPE